MRPRLKEKGFRGLRGLVNQGMLEASNGILRFAHAAFLQ